MKIACVGAGPAGLYFSLLLKLREELVTEIERVNGAVRGSLRKVDPARHRDLMLEEMATMQLVDLLRETSRLKH